LFKYLVEKGADVNAKNNNYETAIVFAIERKDPEIIKLIEKYEK
jgi:ankyrin repeat protein